MTSVTAVSGTFSGTATGGVGVEGTTSKASAGETGAISSVGLATGEDKCSGRNCEKSGGDSAACSIGGAGEETGEGVAEGSGVISADLRRK